MNLAFMPHIHCYLGQPALVWSMFFTDSLIGLAYLGISIVLWWLVRHIEIPFSPIVFCFGLFIAACGATHVMEVWTLWHPDYWVSAAIKAVTAAASIGTGVYLYLRRHAIIDMVAAAHISNQRRLDLEILTQDLETKVIERTSALEQSTHGLRQSELLQRQIMNSSEDFFCILNLRGEILSVTENSLRQTEHVNIESLLGRPWSALWPRFEDQKLANEAVSLAVCGKRGQFEAYYPTPSGKKQWWDVVVTPVLGDRHQPEKILCVARDITERKLAEEERGDLLLRLQRALAARDDFISIATHELKTPLTSMSMQMQLLNRKLERQELVGVEALKNCLALLDRQIDKLVTLTDDLLDMSGFRSHSFAMQVSRQNLTQLVEETIRRLRIDTGAEISLLVEKDIFADVDMIRFDQVVTNLVNNAIKHGGGQVEVFLRHKDLHWTSLIVKDHGAGIAAEDLERIFERFERAVGKSGVSGMGLGLYIVRRIVEGHRGTVRVESQLRQGSTFIVEFPRVIAPAVSEEAVL